MALQIPQAPAAGDMHDQDDTPAYLLVKNTFLEFVEMPANNLDEKSPTNKRSRSESSRVIPEVAAAVSKDVVAEWRSLGRQSSSTVSAISEETHHPNYASTAGQQTPWAIGAVGPWMAEWSPTDWGSDASSTAEWTSRAMSERCDSGMDVSTSPVRGVSDAYSGMSKEQGMAAAMLSTAPDRNGKRGTSSPKWVLRGNDASRGRAAWAVPGVISANLGGSGQARGHLVNDEAPRAQRNQQGWAVPREIGANRGGSSQERGRLVNDEATRGEKNQAWAVPSQIGAKAGGSSQELGLLVNSEGPCGEKNKAWAVPREIGANRGGSSQERGRLVNGAAPRGEKNKAWAVPGEIGANAGGSSQARGLLVNDEATRGEEDQAWFVHGDEEVTGGASSPEWAPSEDDDAPNGESSQPNRPFGSAGHAKGQCRPCAHIWRRGGCYKGDLCSRCHLCDEAVFRRYRQGYRKFVRAARRAGNHNRNDAPSTSAQQQRGRPQPSKGQSKGQGKGKSWRPTGMNL